MIKHKIIISFLLLTQILGEEIKVKEIYLKGLITDKKQEISGMDWYQDKLFLLPENLGGFLFAISKIEILSAIDNKRQRPITPKQTKFTTPDYSIMIPGFDGFEAISFNDDKVFISIEAEDNGIMKGYIAWGEINPKTLEIQIKDENLKIVNTPIQIDNMSFESLVFHNNELIMMYEANGINLQKKVKQPVFSLKEKKISYMDSENIEYRITDITKVNQSNRFWGINYFWPGDEKLLLPGKDLILNRIIKGKSHSQSNTVERLIEFELKGKNIILTNNNPIQLILDPNNSRNWEAIARLDDKGLLIATDKYPKMILGFVPFN
ncbi:MAG: hypothetical protein ACJZ12_02970 [Candidatus Neomarinimicrobiota bacterium]